MAVMLEAVLKLHPQAGVLEGGGHSVRLPGQQWFLFQHRMLEDSQPSPLGELNGKQQAALHLSKWGMRCLVH